MKRIPAVVTVCAATALLHAGCGSDDEGRSAGGGKDASAEGSSGASGGGSGGQGGTAGTGGTGVSGSGGSSGATGGSSGSSGSAGASGAAGSGGASGTAGASGAAGSAGAAGSSGSGGAAGSGGLSGSGGAAGAGGAAGTAGSAGGSMDAGVDGSGGSAGMSGASGASGAGATDAGSDASDASMDAADAMASGINDIFDEVPGANTYAGIGPGNWTSSGFITPNAGAEALASGNGNSSGTFADLGITKDLGGSIEDRTYEISFFVGVYNGLAGIELSDFSRLRIGGPNGTVMWTDTPVPTVSGGWVQWKGTYTPDVTDLGGPFLFDAVFDLDAMHTIAIDGPVLATPL